MKLISAHMKIKLKFNQPIYSAINKPSLSISIPCFSLFLATPDSARMTLTGLGANVNPVLVNHMVK